MIQTEDKTYASFVDPAAKLYEKYKCKEKLSNLRKKVVDQMVQDGKLAHNPEQIEPILGTPDNG